MLTMRLVELDTNGHEQIHEVIRVWADKTQREHTDDGPDTYEVWGEAPYEDETKLIHFAQHGMIYVLNEMGAEIAQYYLGRQRRPPSNEVGT